jgi:aerobic carbon-monoxide dehydrogenase large subunit
MNTIFEPSPSSRRKTVAERSVTRLEDLPIVTGRSRFAASISFPHQLHMRVVRSAHAYGRIVSIDTAAARAAPGCYAVWAAGDVADIPPIDFRATEIKGLEPYRQPVLAGDFVRYVGEPVALVFAEDEYRAEDIADLVKVDISEQPPILSALDPPGRFSGALTTEPTVVRKEFGDVNAAFSNADRVVKLDLSIGRHSGVPLETRGAVARYDSARDIIELHAATKRVHPARDLIAKLLQRSPSSVQLYECHVGGGFGIRGEVYPEDILVCAAAVRLKRPVKWIEDRREHLIAANHSRQQQHRIRAAIDDAGRILAIDDEFFLDQGAYIRTAGARVAEWTASMLPGPYDVPAYRVAGHFRLTNKTPAGTYRSPGRYESTFVCEQLMDAIADRTGIDRIEVRRRNLIAKAAMPYVRRLSGNEAEVVLDSGDYAGMLDKALKRVDWDSLQAEIKRRRTAGEAVGAGLSFFLEKSGLGPVDGVRVNVDSSGAVVVTTSSASLGQGVETVIAQICADALGVDYRNVRVLHGRTDLIEWGFGAHASRGTVMTGSATHLAALKVRAKALAVAAAELQESEPGRLSIIDGRVMRGDRPSGPSITLAEIASALSPASAIKRGHEPGLSAEGIFAADHMTYPYGVHIAAVTIDRETGRVTIDRYLAAYDVGVAVNPMLVEGQMIGSMAQGLGGALFEEFVYDDAGSPLAVNFADYLMPTCRDVPHVDVLLTEDAPSTLNPLGVKGAGESGITGVGAALVSAINDALGVPGAVTALPITPARLKRIINELPPDSPRGRR